MAARRKVIEAAPARRRPTAARRPVTSDYFAAGDEKDLDFISSGCALFDCVLGGGYVLGRVTNIVGDKSSGKTLLAIEACANFARQYSTGDIYYAEAEAAFDVRYAEALGMPVDRVQFVEKIQTVEDLYESLEKITKEHEGKPGIYIVDSLDALSDRAEQERKIDEGSYGGNKPKKMGEMFRRLIKMIESSRLAVIIISQLRDKIGVTFGETKTRSGGRALDFYASQIVWLAEIEKLKKTVDKVERIIGVRVRARCKKNKVGMPFRDCDYPIVFGYGIDDLTASVEWLLSVGREELLAELGLSKNGYKVRLNNLRGKGGDEVADLRKHLNRLVTATWREIELKFLPTARKY